MPETHSLSADRTIEEMPGEREGYRVTIELDSEPSPEWARRFGSAFTDELPGQEAAGMYSYGLGQGGTVVLLEVRDDAHAESLHAALARAIDTANAG